MAEFEKLSNGDRINLFRVSMSTRAFNETIKKLRHKIFGACLGGILQELVSTVPLFALYKSGIFLPSVKHGDHRTLQGIAAITDFVLAQAGKRDHSHIQDFFRNHFLKSTGGNKGRDGNVHWAGCKECRILGMPFSDMGRMIGILLGYVEEMYRMEGQYLDSSLRPIGIGFYGNGAEQQGIIHEAKNWTASSNYKWTEEEFKKRYQERFPDIFQKIKKDRTIRGAPLWYIINDNKLALFADEIEECGKSDLKLRALGYGDMVGVEVYDTNPAELYEESMKAIARAQNLISTLMVIHSYRGTGHNEDQIVYEKGAVERLDFGSPKKVFGISDLSEFRNAWKNDPLLKVFKEYLVRTKAADVETLDTIVKEERERINQMAEEILQEPDITLEEDKKDRTIFAPVDWSRCPVVKPIKEYTETKLMGYNEAYAWILSKLMEEDIRVTYFGEDVGSSEGGVLGLTKGLFEKFGPSRIFNTPIAEEALAANAAGRGLCGSKPWDEFQFTWFYLDAAVVFECVAPQWYQKKMKFDFRSVFPCGIVRSGGSGNYHEQWPEKFLYGTEGVAIVVPANAFELVGLMRAANEFEGPVAILLQISAANYPEFSAKVPLEDYVIPFGKARIVKEGNDCTVITYGAACVSAAKHEAEFLEKEEDISVEVIDLRTLFPLDRKTIIESARKTGRLLVFHEASKKKGLGADILYEVLLEEDGALDRLKVNYAKAITAGMEGDIFISTAKELVWARLPYYKSEAEVIDEEGNKRNREIHRSRKLAHYIRDAVTNYR